MEAGAARAVLIDSGREPFAAKLTRAVRKSTETGSEDDLYDNAVDQIEVKSIPGVYESDAVVLTFADGSRAYASADSGEEAHVLPKSARLEL